MSTPTGPRCWDRDPKSPAAIRFFDLRASGYTGPIDQDGYPVSSGRAADNLHHLARRKGTR
ncbi:MAG: hypothetical protein ABIQ18_46845 [Umezawaea sp.]